MAQITTTTATDLGGFTIPWDQLRKLLPDERWVVYAAGWVYAPGPAVTATIAYQTDGGTLIPVGSTALPTGALQKAAMGPYPVRGDFAMAMGVPAGERIISVVFRAALGAAGAAATLKRWTMWLRMSPRST